MVRPLAATNMGILVAALGIPACGDTPIEPLPEVSSALSEEANSAGMGTSIGTDVPQGSAPFTGVGGITMEATAEEFIQRVTVDGIVLQTSGVSIYAVPAGGATASFDRQVFGAARTGSLSSVGPGTYAISDWPDIDFIREVMVVHGQVRPTGSSERARAGRGTITIRSLEYRPDVHTCTLESTRFNVERCDYQIGVVTGSVEFDITLPDGTELVQPGTEFTLPIRRRTIVATLVYTLSRTRPDRRPSVRGTTSPGAPRSVISAPAGR